MLDPDISTRDALAHLHVPETDPYALDRRRFLQLVGMGVGAGLVSAGGGSLLDHLVVPGDAAWAAGPIGPQDGILIVIGMFGGNDGLNSVVPITDPRYYEMHGDLAVPAADTLPIDADTGLHPELTELANFWSSGQLAIVEGIGYPDPDLSHFNSMAYWMSGRPNAIPSSGWLGRWLDGYLGGSKDLYAAAEVGHSVPLHLVGTTSRGTVVPRSKPGFGADGSARSQRQYQAIRDMRTASLGAWGDLVSQTFVDTLDMAATLAPVIPESDYLPDDDIVASLEIAARLVNADIGFRVLTAGFGDFDSHAGQPTQHRDRMRELNAAIQRFYAVLDPAWHTRVTIATFSEFGRTPWKNDGAGTDHGTSAPHFVIGHNVKGGRYGQRPTLAGLRRWDRMAHHVDLRSYYASLLDGWMGGGSGDVLGGAYENLGLFRRGPGVLPDGTIAPPPAVITEAAGLVPVAPVRVCDTRNGEGGIRVGPVGPAQTVKVPVLGKGEIPPGGVTAVAANVTSTGATQPMYLTVSPGSTARPNTSNLNGGPGRAVPNLVVMGVGTDGCIDVFNSHGSTHVVVDVFGYFTASGGDRFTPVTPKRLFDTRTGQGIAGGKLRNLVPVDVQVAGQAGVPASGATAVVLNLTAAGTESPGYMRVAPAGQPRALTSNVNFVAGDVVPNLVICKLGADGKVTLDAAGSGTHAVADVFGYFGTGGGRLRAMPPRRLLDTRIGLGSAQAPVGPNAPLTLPIAGRESVPLNATAVVLNVTVVRIDRPSYLLVYPDGADMPDTSNLNAIPGRAIANLVICRLGDEGRLQFANPIGSCDVIADVLGFFEP